MEDYIEHNVRTKFEKWIRSAFKIIFFALLIIAFILLFGYAFMCLWNWLMPDIFGLTTISYWQAIGLLVLAKLVFGGFQGRGRGKRGKKWKGRCRPRNHWAHKNDFSKWKLYNKFWEEEGEKAYDDYVSRQKEERYNP